MGKARLNLRTRSVQSECVKQRFGGSKLVRILIHRRFPACTSALAIPTEQFREKPADIAKREPKPVFAQRGIKHAHRLIRRESHTPKITEFALFSCRACSVAVLGIAVNASRPNVRRHLFRQFGVLLAFQPNVR